MKRPFADFLPRVPQVVAALVGLMVCGTASTHVRAADVSSQDPYRIFAKAQAYWGAQRYPDIVGYVIHVQASSADKTEDRHYVAQWFARTNDVIIDPVSLEEKTDPYVPPPGFDFSIFGASIAHVGGPKEGKGTNGDLIGVPLLSPNYAFIAPYLTPRKRTPAEIVRDIRAQYNDRAPDRVSALDNAYPPTIASVYSASAYRISLVGIETVGDHRDYHLSLTPIKNPDIHRLRDVWVNMDSSSLDKIRIAGNFLDRATARVFWTVSYQNVGGVEYINTESTEAPMRHWYDHVTISFEDVHIDAKGALEPLLRVYTLIREPTGH